MNAILQLTNANIDIKSAILCSDVTVTCNYRIVCRRYFVAMTRICSCLTKGLAVQELSHEMALIYSDSIQSIFTLVALQKHGLASQACP